MAIFRPILLLLLRIERFRSDFKQFLRCDKLFFLKRSGEEYKQYVAEKFVEDLQVKELNENQLDEVDKEIITLKGYIIVDHYLKKSNKFNKRITPWKDSDNGNVRPCMSDSTSTRS
ncbi:hypothetical protein K501DRAFT_279882 [Backusella circina FSU 941]|nr:hypothetical protein K501DRAFT_279882 [Backusella circina FSU 941]